MSRRYINQYGEGEQLDETFLASEKQLRSNRNGNLYLQVRLSDRSGSLTAMLWNANERLYNSFENGDFLKVTGATQVYNGGMQVILNRIDKADPALIDESDFITLDSQAIDRMAQRLSELLRSVKNYHLRNLCECFLVDECFMDRYCRAPAGVKNHHAYQGGLLEHVISLMELIALVAPRYPQIDPDLLMLGAFLHDMGKITELTYERELGYSDEGQLIGHMVIGVTLLEDKIREAEKLSGDAFPEELALRLKHMIVSHHGKLEFGSPKPPMTLEALALHYLDTLDAKIHSFHRLMEDDSNSQSRWTTYFPNLQRKLYKS